MLRYEMPTQSAVAADCSLADPSGEWASAPTVRFSWTKRVDRSGDVGLLVVARQHYGHAIEPQVRGHGVPALGTRGGRGRDHGEAGHAAMLRRSADLAAKRLLRLRSGFVVAA